MWTSSKLVPKVGIQYDEPTGKNDGSVGETRYFTCQVKHRCPDCAIIINSIITSFPIFFRKSMAALSGLLQCRLKKTKQYLPKNTAVEATDEYCWYLILILRLARLGIPWGRSRFLWRRDVVARVHFEFWYASIFRNTLQYLNLISMKHELWLLHLPNSKLISVLIN